MNKLFDVALWVMQFHFLIKCLRETSSSTGGLLLLVLMLILYFLWMFFFMFLEMHVEDLEMKFSCFRC